MEIYHSLDQHIREDVYGAYSPTSYKRREGAGGLELSSQSRVFREGSSNVLLVYSASHGNESLVHDGYYPDQVGFSKIINYGLQGKKVWPGRFPRPFVTNAQADAGDITMKILRRKYDHI